MRAWRSGRPPSAGVHSGTGSGSSGRTEEQTLTINQTDEQSQTLTINQTDEQSQTLIINHRLIIHNQSAGNVTLYEVLTHLRFVRF